MKDDVRRISVAEIGKAFGLPDRAKIVILESRRMTPIPREMVLGIDCSMEIRVPVERCPTCGREMGDD